MQPPASSTQSLSPKSPAAKPQSQPSHTKNPTQNNPIASGSGSEEEEQQQPQPVAPPPKQATTSKKRKWSSEADQTPIASTCAAENGGVGGSVGEKEYFYLFLKDKISRMKKNQMDIDEERLAGSKKKVKFDGSSSSVDTEEFMIKEALEILGDEERSEIEEAWNKLVQVRLNKLQVRLNKLREEKMAILGQQLMYSCLSGHSSSSLEGEGEEEEEEDCLSDQSLSSLEEEEEEEAEEEGEEEHMQQTEASINPAKEQVQMEEEDGKKED